MFARKFGKFWLGLAVILISTFLFSFSISAKTIIRIGTTYEPGSIEVRVAEKFKELIHKADPDVEVQLFVGGAVGSEEEVTESVKVGGLEAQVGGGIPIKMYALPYQFFDGLYVLKDWEHYKRVHNNSPLGKKMQALVEEKGNATHLGIYYRGMRQLMHAKKPIYKPEDMKGVKFRIPMIPTWVTIWKETGALPVPVPFSEVFMALQTGVADACEMDLPSFFGHRLYEVQKYLMMTNHMVQVGRFTMNVKFLNGLPKAKADLVRKMATEACQHGVDYMMQNEQKFVNDLVAKGMIQVQPDVAAFRTKVKPAIDGLFKTTWNVATWDEILKY
jgi:TRAP-type C4-dicarboxylate transport system substrate-binding protein